MLALSKRTPQEKRTKARSGCKACKARRIKCDETRPGCAQCSRRKTQCPGYNQKIKWSYKYEKLGSGSETQTNARFRESNQINSKSSSPSLQSFFEQAEDSASTLVATSEAQDFSVEEVNSESPPVIGVTGLSVPVAEIVPFDFNTLPLKRNETSNRGFWDPGPTDDAMLYSPALELQYFAQTICVCLCAYDSPSNLLRSVVVAKVRVSRLYHSLLRYLVTAYLCNNDPIYSTQSLVEEARADTLHSLQHGTRILIHGTGSKMLFEDILLAKIMYGLTTSWDGSNNTGIQHYKSATNIYTQCGRSMSSATKSFFSEMLVYWWTGLCFITDAGRESLPPPPSLSTVCESDSSCSQNSRIYPHPLTGISPQVHVLMGKVGALLYAQRARALKISFTTRRTIQQEEDAIGHAYTIEEELLALHIPKFDIAYAGDLSAPLADLRNTAEAYRLCGLLLLYRGFPDLLQKRMSVIEEGSLSAQLWLSSLALYILDILSDNNPASGTRSVEQILLVIIAGELHTLRYQEEEHDFSWLPDLEQPFLHIEGGHHAITIEAILQARTTVLRRLAAVRSILPYRSLDQVQGLISEIWRKSDAGEQVFWMDVMIQNEWKFLMA